MGGRAGGGASGGMGSGSRGGLSGRARELANKYLGGVSDPKLKKELADGMAAFEKEFGDLPSNLTVSVGHISVSGKSNDAMGAVNGFNQLRISDGFTAGRFSMSEAKHTMIHELTHTLDKTDTHHSANIDGIKMKGWRPVGQLKKENKVFDRKLTAAYKKFKFNYGSAQSKPVGSYALTSKHEFFAEAVAHHLTGTKTSYTTFAYNLAKSMAGK